jgi:hypothetical protein
MSCVSFLLPLAWNECRKLPKTNASANFTRLDQFTVQEEALVNSLVRFQCDVGEYNELASLFFTEQACGVLPPQLL